MTVGIEPWCDERAILGEGIIWDRRRGRLFWVDIKRAKLFESSTDGPGAIEWAIEGDIGSTLGCIAVDPESDGFLAAAGSGLFRLECNDKERVASVHKLVDPESGFPRNRFNDGAIDPLGGFWAGTMDDSEEMVSGSWWRWDGQSIKKVLGGFKVTNGPVFVETGEDEFHVFLTDSARAKVFKGTYSLKDGLSSLGLWAQFDPSEGYPDGMCVDSEGLIWIAFWDGAAIRAYDALQSEAGEPLRTINLPVQRPTKLALTPDGDFFVTSAALGSSTEDHHGDDRERDLNGLLLRVDRLIRSELV